MRILKIIGKCCFWIGMLALLLVPVFLIFQLSTAEMAEYKAAKPPVILDSAYGEIQPAYRGDVAEYTTVSGTYVCNQYAYMELTYKNPDQIRWEVSTGDLIHEGQAIGDYQGEPVISELTGVLTQIQSFGTEPYLQVRLLNPVELECKVPDAVLTVLERGGGNLTDQDGNSVAITYTAPMKNADGTTTVRLSLSQEDGICGQSVQGLTLYTGRVYSGVLLLDVDCIYQKDPGEGLPWYVRRVSPEGIFQEECEVQLGYTDGKVICVTGVNEGDCFDAGYKFILEGSQK